MTDIRDQCLEANVAFFFKQWGGVQKKKSGRILEGRTWDELPGLAVISEWLDWLSTAKKEKYDVYIGRAVLGAA